MHAQCVKVEPCTYMYVHVPASFRVSFSIACLKSVVYWEVDYNMLGSLAKYELHALSENSQEVLVFKLFL